MRRRSFLGLAAGALLDAILPPANEDADGAEALTAALLGTRRPGHTTRPDGAPPTVANLRQAVAAVKTSYQACRYTEASRSLAGVLAGLDAATGHLDGDQRRTVDALAADAWHVAASLALKLGREGPAWLAAHHSIRAAEHSADPLAAGRSARIMTHVLMDGRQHAAAHAFASRAAQTLAAAWGTPTAEVLSVYGALLLRGAIAAARHGDRTGAATLLDEAEAAAHRLGGDHNHGWTAFGPANVALHRVNTAITLGDAGTALEHARRVDADRLPIPERRAALFLDIAAAYAQWGKHDHAYHALRTPEATAPEELARRPAVRTLVHTVCAHAPLTVQHDVHALAAHPAFGRSVAELRAAGVRVLLGPGQREPHPPGTGDRHRAAFPWEHALNEAEQLTDHRGE